MKLFKFYIDEEPSTDLLFLDVLEMKQAK